MHESRFAAAAIAFALAGCACVFPDRAPVATADKFNPEVRMVAGVPEAPEVLRFGRGEKGRITWHLKDKGYRFALADGIRFEARAAGEIVDCRRERNEAKFSCENRHAKDGQGLFYKYDINVEDERGARFTKDPFVLND
jgi:hypothetical protein